VRIIPEALASFREHSAAHSVFVHFARKLGHYELWVEDDGRGFGFTGHLLFTELEIWSNCPLVIEERVRAIGGELVIESAEGWGSRLQILVPLAAHGRVSSDD
jgi:signal transduction histidine kinase